jgi:hypothetical protein
MEENRSLAVNSNLPRNATEPLPEANSDPTIVHARYSWSERGLAYVSTAMFLTLFCGGMGVFGQAPDSLPAIIGAFLALLGIAMSWSSSETVTANRQGLVWKKWFRPTRQILWSEIDEATDSETRLHVGCSWRATRIGLSRRLQCFVPLLDAVNEQSQIKTLLQAHSSGPLPATFRVGWNELTGVLIFGPLAIGLALLAAVVQDPTIAGFAAAALGLTVFGAPYLRCRIFADRFEFRSVLKTTVVPFSDLVSFEFDSEEFHSHGIKVGQLTNHKLLFYLVNDHRLEFAPRSGALAMRYCATAAVESWRAASRAHTN